MSSILPESTKAAANQSTPEVTRALKPCPFCGSADVEVLLDTTFDDPTWDALCAGCKACVARDLQADAIVAWNTRTPARGGDELREAAQFLSDRLDDLEWLEGDLEATLRDFMGHVDPAHARLKHALASPPPVDRAEAIPAGMKPWHGGDSAPDDWDGGDVLCRDGGYLTKGDEAPDKWGWGNDNRAWDIIAYTPKPAAPPVEGLTSGDALLREALQRIQDEPDHTLPIVTAQRLRNIASFALLGERLP